MVLLAGISSLLFMCSSILALTCIASKAHQKNGSKEKKQDPFQYLFDVYDQTSPKKKANT
ncbi:hypothetical protein [Bacillus sp. JCM 19041]|uniref:hypothetical protein n=1 Tax=Bacillus sp. JCM 19041 TaxID=1460637 RepID=UPI0006D17414